VTSTIVIVSGGGTFDPITKSAVTESSDIIGGERDIQLTLQEGENQVVSALVRDGVYTVTTSTSGRGFASLVYDGQDGDGVNIDTTGLSLNLNDNSASAIRLVYSVDVDTTIQLNLYSGSSQCTYSFAADGQPNVDQTETIDYGDFSGSCNFGNIGAIELLIPLPNPVDIEILTILLVGPAVSATPSPSRVVVAASATRTPSPSRVVGSSASRTPVVVASASPTPAASASATPTPSPSAEVVGCECNCPAFRCGLVYAVPGDDDDTVDDDTHDDDDIIYRPIYYGPVDDDFDGIDGDDDEFPLISRMGGLTIYHNDDDDDNSAGLVSLSFFLLAAALLI